MSDGPIKPWHVIRRARRKSAHVKKQREVARTTESSKNAGPSPKASAPKKSETARPAIAAWPSFSIISPSYDQAQFLPECLQSVAMQAYDGTVEHIVVDPGSTDGSTEIAAAAAGVTLINEPDSGQSDAISKGFARSSGDILAWLNSDDQYADDTVFRRIAEYFDANPHVDVAYGKVDFVGADNEFLRTGYVNADDDNIRASFTHQVGIVQPGLFMRRAVYDAVGGPSVAYHYALDYEYWVRIAVAGFIYGHLDEPIAKHRWHDDMKTASNRGESYMEHVRTVTDNYGFVHPKWIRRIAEYNLAGIDGIVAFEQDSVSDADLDLEAARLHEALNTNARTVAMLDGDFDTAVPGLAAGLDDLRADLGRLGVAATSHSVDLSDATAAAALGLTVEARASTAPEPTAWYLDHAIAADGSKWRTYEIGDGWHVGLEAAWADDALELGARRLAEASARRTSDICVLVGNGPSLRQTPFDLLAEFDVCLTNRALMNAELAAMADYVAVTNRMVTGQFGYELNLAQVPFKFAPVWLEPHLDDSWSLFNADLRKEFSPNVMDWVSWRSTVTYFAMQMLYSLGYRTVLMVGFDHSYVQPEGAAEGDSLKSDADDGNHFDPNYFRSVDWQAADTAAMEEMYGLAKAGFEADGRAIYNCTVGGELELFERRALDSFKP